MNTIKKIAFVSNFSHYRMGGQKSMLALIENLDLEKFEPIVFLPCEGELSEYLDRIRVRCYFLQTPPLKPKNIVRIYKTYKEAKQVIKRERINLIHSDFERDALLFGYLSKRLKIKSIWHIRLTRSTDSDKYILKYNDGIIGISNACYQRVKKELFEYNHYATIFNGVDTRLFSPIFDRTELRFELGLEANVKYVLFVGQLKDGKGIKDLIEAFRFIDNKNVKLLLAGKEESPHKLTEYRNMVTIHNLNENVEFVGQVNDIHRYMQAVDLLILPSYEGVEGMGRVMFEAMACGTPAMGSDTSGVNEAIIDDKLKFEQRNSVQIADKIVDLFSDEQSFSDLKIKSREVAVKNFDIIVHARRVMKIYDKLLKK